MVLGTNGLNFIFPRPPLILISGTKKARAGKCPTPNRNSLAGYEYVIGLISVK
jgi:hypothetical protein